MTKYDVPQLPVIDLITGRVDSKEEEVTSSVLYGCQYTWGFTEVYRLAPDRRKELCSLLVSLVAKVAPELKDSDCHRLWAEVVKNPSHPDEVMDSIDDVGGQ